MTEIFFEMFTMIRTHPNKNISENQITKQRQTNGTMWENLQEINIA